MSSRRGRADAAEWGPDASTPRTGFETRRRRHETSEAEIRKAVGYGRYMIREMEGVIQLKKYRTLKARGYGGPAQGR